MFDDIILIIMNSVIGNVEWVLMSGNKRMVFFEWNMMQSYSKVLSMISDVVLPI